ncbi:hypothetical protein GTU73_17125 [Rathayibacter sp. VKM Ac-2804]|uniref:hypothetical protein n=1 Tax=unclassified Rathayibacter TaxID=2609250 RepID=UPI00132F4902|nr:MULTISPECIES: hypothetical protein [unclassified Rathayibacter]NRG41257.1 hypothetical protein [Rathayibacter sp. VKM Ac-2835]QHF25546.1 hypothetical protein GTU73_17125 [Rathayibacter sp. VKM Ac-2804]
MRIDDLLGTARNDALVSLDPRDRRERTSKRSASCDRLYRAGALGLFFDFCVERSIDETTVGVG